MNIILNIGLIVTFIIVIIVILSLLTIIYKIVNKIIKHIRENNNFNINIVKEKKGDFIGFKNSIKEIDLPVITLSIYKEKFNFLLDSGANLNYIDIQAIEILLNKGYKFETTRDAKSSGMGDGEFETIGAVIPLKYGNYNLETEIQVGNIGESLNIGNNNMKIHGILGHNFFQEYKWKLDFEDKVVWIKSSN